MACSEAAKRAKARYRETHREELRAKNREYGRTHKAERAAYYQANREELRAKQNAYNAEHAEESRRRAMEWYYANPERAKATRAKWRRENVDRVNEMLELWRLANPERFEASRKARRARRRARLAGAPGRYTADDVAAQMAEQDGCCMYCGERVTDYHVDHYIPLARGGSNGPENIVIACPPCNLKKGTKMPHEFEVVA